MQCAICTRKTAQNIKQNKMLDEQLVWDIVEVASCY